MRGALGSERMLRRALCLTLAATLSLGAVIVWAVVRPPGGVYAGGGGAHEVAVHAHTWGFGPRAIHVRRGDSVRFTVVSEDIRHGFAINELGINLNLTPGEARRSPLVTVDLPEGRYTIHCSTFCGLGHPAMKGALVVGNPGPAPGSFVPWVASAVGLGSAVAFVARARPRRTVGGGPA